MLIVYATVVLTLQNQTLKPTFFCNYINIKSNSSNSNTSNGDDIKIIISQYNLKVSHSKAEGVESAREISLAASGILKIVFHAFRFLEGFLPLFLLVLTLLSVLLLLFSSERVSLLVVDVVFSLFIFSRFFVCLFACLFVSIFVPSLASFLLLLCGIYNF